MLGRRNTGGRAVNAVRLGTVASVTEDGLYTMLFDGETAASGKGYPAIETGITLAEGDRAAAIRVRGSYLILGKYRTGGSI